MSRRSSTGQIFDQEEIRRLLQNVTVTTQESRECYIAECCIAERGTIITFLSLLSVIGGTLLKRLSLMCHKQELSFAHRRNSNGGTQTGMPSRWG